MRDFLQCPFLVSTQIHYCMTMSYIVVLGRRLLQRHDDRRVFGCRRLKPCHDSGRVHAHVSITIFVNTFNRRFSCSWLTRAQKDWRTHSPVLNGAGASRANVMPPWRVIVVSSWMVE